MIVHGCEVMVDPDMEGCKSGIWFKDAKILYVSPAIMGLLETDYDATVASLLVLDANSFVERELAKLTKKP